MEDQVKGVSWEGAAEYVETRISSRYEWANLIRIWTASTGRVTHNEARRLTN